MGRRSTNGYESRDTSNTWFLGIDGMAGATYETTIVRSGSSSAKCSASTGVATCYARSDYADQHRQIITVGNSAVFFIRGYYYVESLPVITAQIMRGSYGKVASVDYQAGVRLTSAGKLKVFAASTESAESSTSLATGQWYRVEVHGQLDFTDSTHLRFRIHEIRVNGSSLGLSADETVVGTVDTAVNPPSVNPRFGWITAPNSGAGAKVIYVDDTAWNDDQGATQNSWPGEGNIVLLKPVSDNARGANWLDGGGGTTSLFEAVNNTPPTGSGTPANGIQIKNTAKDTTGNYDANLTTYDTAGVPSTATVTLVSPIFVTGATKSVTGAEMFVSNPTGPAETSMDFFTSNSRAAGTYNDGWKTDFLAPIYGDISGANRSVSPVIRIGKRQSSTNAAYCAFMGAYVEYVEAAAGGGDDVFPYVRGGYFPQ